MNNFYSNIYTNYSSFLPSLEKKGNYLFHSNTTISPYFLHSKPSNYTLLSFNNDIQDSKRFFLKYLSKTPVNTGVVEGTTSLDNYFNFSDFPNFDSGYTITIPRKVEYVLRHHIPKKVLALINANVETAIELCLLFLSKFSGSYFYSTEEETNFKWIEKDESKAHGWIELKAKYLKEEFSGRATTYKHIVNALEFVLRGGPILEKNNSWTPWIRCMKYRLSDNYRNKGVIKYALKQNEAKRILDKYINRSKLEARSNPIVRMQKEFIKRASYPTYEYAEKLGKELIKQGFITKKGKKLKALNKRKKEEYDLKTTAFLEEHLERYKRLIESSKLKYPRVTQEKNGRRVVDFLTLMSSWIRMNLLLDMEELCECDYQCFHPNIAMTLYGGRSRYLNHEDIAKVVGKEKIDVKRAHLSFFNMPFHKMIWNDVYFFYKEKEPEALSRIINEKRFADKEHAITTEKLFSMETTIMSAVTEKLWNMGIVVNYVYDALQCKVSERNIVLKVMNETALEFGVYTRASCDYEKKFFPLKGWEDQYLINRKGEVKSLNKRNYYENLKVVMDSSGDKAVFLYKDGKTQSYKIETLLKETFAADIHKNENNTSNTNSNLLNWLINPKHLFNLEGLFSNLNLRRNLYLNN